MCLRSSAIVTCRLGSGGTGQTWLAARAKSELLGKQLGSRMLYVHWTEVGSLTFPMLHSRCLCVDRLPPSLVSAQDLLASLADTHAPIFCQVCRLCRWG